MKGDMRRVAFGGHLLVSIEHAVLRREEDVQPEGLRER